MSRFWQFAQLSEKYRGLRPMDQIEDAGKLYIGGLSALDAPDRLEKAAITHILSVLEFDYCDYEEFEKYQRLLIQAEDHSQENLLKHFERTSAFIEDNLRGDSAIIVHCAMGISRSVTVVCAYLMKKLKINPEEALEIIRRARPLCSPNEGFLEQLQVYHQILNASSEADAGKIYSEWRSKVLERPKI